MSIGDRIQSRWDNIQAHPIQNLLGFGLGTMIPGGGLLANRLFGMYNNGQFNNSAGRLQQNITNQGNQAGSSFMDKPLNGPLGQVSGGQGNADLAQAFMGNMGSPANTGNLNMSNFFGRSPQSFSGPNAGGLLDFLGPAPQSGPGGTFANGGAMNYAIGPSNSGFNGFGSLGSNLGGSSIGANTAFGGTYWVNPPGASNNGNLGSNRNKQQQ